MNNAFTADLGTKSVEDFTKVFETIFGYAPFMDMFANPTNKPFDPVQDTKNVFATNNAVQDAVQTANGNTSFPDLQATKASKTLQENTISEYEQYQRDRTVYEDIVREQQEDYEREQYEIEREFDQRTTALELAIEALGDNAVHANQPIALAKEILQFLQEGNPE